MKIIECLSPARLLLTACLALAAAWPALAGEGGLAPFKATYDASYMGLHGAGTMTLAASGNGAGNGSNCWPSALRGTPSAR